MIWQRYGEHNHAAVLMVAVLQTTHQLRRDGPAWAAAMEVDEPITIVAYDPDWPRLYAIEQTIIRRALRDNAADIEHIGSTAVPGLSAKPIIDVLAGLTNYPAAVAQIASLAEVGYQCLGEAGVPGRLYFRKRAAQAFNLHLTRIDGQVWNNNLLVRDYLRAHRDEAFAYARHKERLVAEGVTTLLAYSERKAAVVAGLLHKAENWKREQNR